MPGSRPAEVVALIAFSGTTTAGYLAVAGDQHALVAMQRRILPNLDIEGESKLGPDELEHPIVFPAPEPVLVG